MLLKFRNWFQTLSMGGEGAYQLSHTWDTVLLARGRREKFNLVYKDDPFFLLPGDGAK